MTVFTNADFISCENVNRVHRVLVEDGGKIVYIGDAVPDAYAEAQREDLHGACVVPAFADTHIHFTSFSLFLSTFDCRDAVDFDDLGDMISTYANAHHSERVLLGFGCSAHTVREQRLPTLSDLDRITSRPLMIVKYDGHAGVANSSLIKKLPAAVLNEAGFEPASGWFFQDAFYKAVNALTKSVSPFTVLKNLLGGSDYMARKGIGLVHTAEGVGFPFDIDVDLMRAAAPGLRQKFRVYMQTLDVHKALRRKLPCIGGCFATALDGCFGSEDAALRTPYTNNANNRGVLFYTQEQVNAFAKSANRAGLQIAMHAIGDAAIEQALNAYETALADFPREDHRHVLIHADLMDTAMIDKAASLGVAIALQTPFLYWPQEPVEYVQSLLGKRIERLIPLKSMLEAGVLLASGSDGPCTLPDPILGIYAACNHPNSDERLSVLDALRMHTHWGAKLSFDEAERGTLAVGKVADFVVLDQNPLTMPVEHLNNLQIQAVYLQGQRYTGQETGAAQLLMKSLNAKWRTFLERSDRN